MTSPLFPTMGRDNHLYLREVNHPTGSYPYLVGSGLLDRFADHFSFPGPVVLVADQHSAEHFVPQLEPVDLVVTIGPGRNQKTLATVQDVHRQMLDARLDRSTTIVSVGDSIACDIASFAAATYLRGVEVVHLPTEVIAMIDTSIGGKVGLDMPHGRNLVGLFKQPAAVAVDGAALAALSNDIFAAGMTEVVKHGIIEGGPIIDLLKNRDWVNGQHRGEQAEGQLSAVVAQAAAVKIGIVEQDPSDAGLRQVLNLGHTFAYGFESASFGELRHGEAVGLGLVAAARLSYSMGICSGGLVTDVERLVAHVGATTCFPRALDVTEIEAAMAHDKKRKGDRQRFVLLEDLGRPVVVTVEDSEPVVEVLKSFQPT